MNVQLSAGGISAVENKHCIANLNSAHVGVLIHAFTNFIALVAIYPTRSYLPHNFTYGH